MTLMSTVNKLSFLSTNHHYKTFKHRSAGKFKLGMAIDPDLAKDLTSVFKNFRSQLDLDP